MSKEKGLSNLLISVFLVAVFIVNSQANAQVFGNRMDMGLIEYPPIIEASGIAASRKNIDVLWTHNDSGGRSRIYALNTQGKHLGVYNISGIIAANDWEDIAVGPGPVTGEQYIFIGDIGDNYAVRNLKYIHRVLEPKVSSIQTAIETTLSDVETITFEYPDGNRDAETVMVDPLTKDIYVVSKRETHVRVYRIPYPQSTAKTITVDHVATLDLSGGENPPQSWTVGGDISNSGREILMKTRSTIYYWSKKSGQDLWEALNHSPITVPYIEEPHGEAVTWAYDTRGYYTVSEETAGPAHLYFYPRTDEPLPVE
jgi:hypothetical protein